MPLNDKQTMWAKEGFRRELERLQRAQSIFQSDPETAALMVSKCRTNLRSLAKSLLSHGSETEAD